jgi:hypothetical protein
MTSLPTRRRLTAAAFALMTATLVPGLTQLPAVAGSANAAEPIAPDDVVTLGDPVPGLSDLDVRGRVAPTSAVRAAAADLGALDVRFNRFGTPTSLLPATGTLGAASSSDPVVAARDWLRDHAAVFGLTTAQVDDLELVNNQQFAQSPARAVLFQQRFGDLATALDGKVTVGVAHGQIQYVSSSIAPTDAVPQAAELSPTEAWVTAARAIGREVTASDITDVVERGGWTRLTVPEFEQEQQVRLRALAFPDGSVRPVFETNVVDVANGGALAYTLMIDAVTGDVLNRHNQVEHSNDFQPIQGEITATECGPKHSFELTDDLTQQIQVVASTANAANDIVIKLFKGDELLTSADLGTSPETLTYAPGGTIPKGVYDAQVCPFDSPTVPFTPPGNYGGTITTSDQGGGTPSVPLPAWRYFPSNPTLDWSTDHTPKNSVVGCWKILDRDDCTLSTGALAQPYGAPWDVNQADGTSTLTSSGNNAEDREAWISPLTPGGTNQRPVSPTREYFDEFTDAWNNSGCDPAQLTPGGNDINAAVTNLFVAHNRMHDYSYGLGFTELNYNLQQDNLGKNPNPDRANDPELGNVQAGAIGGLQSGLGRDNANQITLQDGTPGITNQYLFQPIAGAFYSPCTDGAMDMSITGHEYTHAISNRMIAGPDEGITSEQGGAMGESWGDLTAAEYMFSHGYKTGGNPWAVGPYATGNKSVGIRDYAINHNPLNYGNYGFDSPGNEVHADGEIWNGTMWEVRQALVKRWDYGVFRYDNKARQHRCAEGSDKQGPLKATRCPGNRRWISLMFDAFLLQQGATSMLDARDAFIAADRMRFENLKNQKPIWDAFAKRGMGKGAFTPNADSGNTKPSFASPKSKNGQVTFRTPTPGRIFVGNYEARSTPAADTIGKTKLDATTAMVPGTYRMLFASAKSGFKRFTIHVKAGQDRVVRVHSPRNLAAKAAGAKVLAASAGSLNPAFLIDGTEDTNWGGVNADLANVDETSPFVTVDLAGKVHRIHRVNVSAMLSPAPDSGTEIPFLSKAADPDPDSGSRFTALRRFALEACVSACGSDNAKWKRFYTSPANAFPSAKPRPVAPSLNLRSFDVPDVKAAAIRLVAIENQCTGFKGYAGDQDSDESNNTDCKTGSDRGSIVHAAELQVY